MKFPLYLLIFLPLSVVSQNRIETLYSIPFSTDQKSRSLERRQSIQNQLSSSLPYYIGGMVYDSKWFKPIIFTRVTLFQNNVFIQESETNVNGIYRFFRIEPGNYTIEVATHKYKSIKRSNLHVIEKWTSVNFEINDSEYYNWALPSFPLIDLNQQFVEPSTNTF